MRRLGWQVLTHRAALAFHRGRRKTRPREAVLWPVVKRLRVKIVSGLCPAAGVVPPGHLEDVLFRLEVKRVRALLLSFLAAQGKIGNPQAEFCFKYQENLSTGL